MRRTLLAVLLLTGVILADSAEGPRPFPAHVGDSVGPFNHAFWPVRVRSLDQVRWTFREGKHAGMAAPIAGGLLFIQAGGGGIRGVEAGTGKRWWIANGNPRYWNYSSCVLGPGGIAYGGNFDHLQAVDRKGKRLWQTHLQGRWIHRPPVVSPDGAALYIGGDNLGLASINAANGRINWLRRDFSSPWSTYVFNRAGHLIVSTRDKLICFDANGAELWSQPEPLGPMLVVDDLLIGVRKGALLALDLNRPKTHWTYLPGSGIVDLAFSDRRRVMVSLLSGELVSLGLDGRPRWRRKLSKTALHRPATVLGGETLVADAAGVLRLVDARGEVLSSIGIGGQPYRWRPTVSSDGDVFLGQADTIFCITGKRRPPPRPVVADELLVVADDFVVEAWVNGRPVPLSTREMVAETHGAMTERIHVDLHKGDWIVFNVVANRLRWGGASYFGVYARAPDGRPAFVSTTEGGWFACDDPAAANAFIARPRAGNAQLAVAPIRPWHDAPARWQHLLGAEFPGQPVWGKRANTWIKYVVGGTRPRATRVPPRRIVPDPGDAPPPPPPPPPRPPSPPPPAPLPTE